jgi:glycosyltransferase involved in cell wall biosynthesis
MADLFVLPSRTEGLPRAMLEAMARALPCIGSTAGGIPELLPAEDMVPPGDALSLALKIRSVLTDPVRLMSMSSRNLEKAKGYHEGILRERRNAFYNSVLDVTREWLLDVDRSS